MPEQPPPGTIMCRNYSRGRRAPITVSRIGPLQALWGRKDIAVYIVALPLLFLTVATSSMWWPLVNSTLHGPAAIIVSLCIFVGVPFIGGAVADMAGLSARDIPRHVLTVTSRVKAPGGAGTAGTGTARPEPRRRLQGVAATTWVIPDTPSNKEA